MNELKLTFGLPGVRNERTHFVQLCPELAVLVLALLHETAVKLHFDLLHLRGDHVSRHIGKVLLDLLDLGQAKARFVRLVIHFEEFDFLQFVLCLPSDRFGLLLWLTGHVVDPNGGVLVERVTSSLLLGRLVRVRGSGWTVRAFGADEKVIYGAFWVACEIISQCLLLTLRILAHFRFRRNQGV